MNYKTEQTKYCVECGKPFATYVPQQNICSQFCAKNRAKRIKIHINKDKFYKDGLLELSGIKDIDLHRQKFGPGQKVTVHQSFEGKKSKRARRARVVECYEYFAVCKLKNYQESFAYENITVI